VDIVAFKFTRGKALRFLPGQQVKLTEPDGRTAELPIASCPCDAQYLEFHLTAETVLADKSGQSVQNILSNITESKRLFLSEGGDFGQLQGMIEQVLNDESDIPCCLIWKATEKVTQYRSNLCRSWHDAFDQFYFVPLSSDANTLGALPEQWHAQLVHCEVYCGNKETSLCQPLIELGVDPAAIYFPD